MIKETKEVVLLAEDRLEIIYYISQNFEKLLDLLPILISYEKIGFLGERYTTEIKNQTLKQIKELLLEKKYFSFFSESIIGK